MSIKLRKNDIKSNYSGGDKYDIIIIGSGISGLSAGCMMLKNSSDKKILIIEKNSYTGGYVTAYEKSGYVFETTQLFPNVPDILEYLGLKIKLKKFPGTFMRRIIVDKGEVSEYRLPAGADNMVKYLSDKFPSEALKIKKFMKYSQEAFAQVKKLKANMTFKDKLLIPFKAPKVLANLNKTYSRYIDSFGITDIKLREVLESFASFSGTPAERGSSILTFGAMLSTGEQCYRPYGFYDEFPAEMTELFQKMGGEVRLSSEVEKIVIKNNCVEGIQVKGDKGFIKADIVITTIDPMHCLKDLVGYENLPAEYVEKLAGILMSPSSINVSIGLDDKIDMTKYDLDYPYNVISTEFGTTEKLYKAAIDGDNGFSKDCFHMGVVCPSLVTGSKNILTLRCVPFGMNSWNKWRETDRKKYDEEKNKWADFFIDIAEKYFVPDLKKHIVVKDISTPATYSRYSGSPTGSIYDMASIVTQFGPKRLSMKTPVKNLYQPRFSHGIYGSLMSGVQVVDNILDGKFNGGNSLFNPVKR